MSLKSGLTLMPRSWLDSVGSRSGGSEKEGALCGLVFLNLAIVKPFGALCSPATFHGCKRRREESKHDRARGAIRHKMRMRSSVTEQVRSAGRRACRVQECSFDRWSVANLALHIGAKNAKTARRTVQASNNEGSQHGTDAVREAVCFGGGGCALRILKTRHAPTFPILTLTFATHSRVNDQLQL